MHKSKALKAVEQVLVREADRIGPALLESLMESYLKVAEDGLASLIENAQDPERKGRVGGFDRWADEARRYVERDPATLKPYQSWNFTWESLRETPEVYRVSAYQVKKSSEEAYEHSRESFIGKNLSKFSEILGKREDLVSFDARVEIHRGVLTGPVVLRLSDAEIHGELSLKYVMRTNPRYTPYFQYPLVFTRAVVRGEEFRRPSEAQLAELISG